VECSVAWGGYSGTINLGFVLVYDRLGAELGPWHVKLLICCIVVFHSLTGWATQRETPWNPTIPDQNCLKTAFRPILRMDITYGVYKTILDVLTQVRHSNERCKLIACKLRSTVLMIKSQ
jgi:hypothetical protein